MNAVNQLGQLPAKKKQDDELAPSLTNRPLVNSAANGAISNAQKVGGGIGAASGLMKGVRNVSSVAGDDIQLAVNKGDYMQAAGATARGALALIPAVADDVFGAPLKMSVSGLNSFARGVSGDTSTAVQPSKPAPPVQQAAYSNEGNNYKAVGGALQSPVVSTSQSAPPPEADSNAALAQQNPAGRVTKTVDANGRTTYSGQNVSGAVSFVGRDGKPLAGAPGGSYNESLMGGGARQQLAGGIGSTAGGGGGGLPLYNVGGTGYSTRENAIMAANIRDGIDPMRGLNGAPQVSIMGNSGAQSKSPGQKYMEDAMSAPRTLTNLTQRQRDRIADTAMRMDATAQQGASDAARLNLQGQELAFRQQDAANRLAMDGQRLGVDMARFNAEEPKRAAELLGMNMKNKEAQKLMAARDAYMNAADGSPEQKTAANRLQVLSGKFGEKGEWDATRVKIGVDANGNPIEGIARMNNATGEVIMPNSPQGTTAKPTLEAGKTYQRVVGGKPVNARYMGNGNWAEVK